MRHHNHRHHALGHDFYFRNANILSFLRSLQRVNDYFVAATVQAVVADGMIRGRLSQLPDRHPANPLQFQSPILHTMNKFSPSDFSKILRSAACAALLALTTTGATASATGIIMPIFGNTSSQFSAAIAAARKVSMIAIINPNNGPGSKKVSGISGYVSQLKSVGARPVGYISTSYGSVSSSSVNSQIDRYASWYGATGIFLDEVADSTSKISYYKAIYSYAHGKGLLVVANPGTFVPSGYASVADVLVTYEDPMSRGWSSQKPSSWTAGYSPSKIGAIVYATPSASMKTVVDRAVAIKYGWIFVSDGSGNDPFGRAPSYLSAEADYVHSKK